MAPSRPGNLRRCPKQEKNETAKRVAGNEFLCESVTAGAGVLIAGRRSEVKRQQRRLRSALPPLPPPRGSDDH